MKNIILEVVKLDVLEGGLTGVVRFKRSHLKRSFFQRIKITDRREKQHEQMHERMIRSIRKVSYWKMKVAQHISSDTREGKIYDSVIGYEIDVKLNALKVRLDKWTNEMEYMLALCEHEADYKLAID